ncbi:MAG: hypothetical protein TEF_11935 [Rhizobiales bacterium NRL2]|jgi:EAL domain-containing protein (putative c-di-GMP-specific phosphodiesterase class I)|nr:MAG: hypothetical protein TEF_11935 [Rhizobiales bacterium NRL2]
MNISLANDFRHALDRGELSPAFQPVRRLSDGTIAGAEALMRWTHAEHGRIESAEFIPVSERTGSIHAPGAWMLEQALSALTGWRKQSAGRSMFVAVNLSVVQLSRSDIATQCTGILNAHGIAPECLHLEVTETAPLDHPAAEEGIRALGAAGFRLAMDDFGAGFSSFTHLHRLPFDTLKIDRSFVGGLDDSRRSRAIVANVVRLAHDLDMTVVAEGVETEWQLRFLRDAGCDLGQGYLLGPPAAAADLARELGG